MTTLNRVTIEYTGGAVVGRAVTVLHYSASDNAAPPVAAIRAAFDAAKGLFPTSLVINVPGEGDKIDDTTGNLAGVWSASQPAPVAGVGSDFFAAGVGCCIGWNTGGIVSGTKGPRKLRGRTFLVPLSTANYDQQGTILTGALGVADALAAALQAAGPLAVWHRPTAPGASDGNSYGVISHRVRDKVAFLSSRRD